MILTVVGVPSGREGCWPQARGVKGARVRARPAVIWWAWGVSLLCHLLFPYACSVCLFGLEGRAGHGGAMEV